MVLEKQIPYPPQQASALAGDPGYGNDKQEKQVQEQTRIPYGNDKQEKQEQVQQQIPYGNDKQEKQEQVQTKIPYRNDKQEEQRQGQLQRQKQIPYGMTSKKSNGKDNCNGNDKPKGSGNCGSLYGGYR